MILAKNLFYSYGNNTIFNGASFFVAKNSKVGLVGANGSGKSTLFKLLTKEDIPEEGRINISGQVMSVPQEVKHDETMEKSECIRDYLDPKNHKEDYEVTR